MNRFDCKCIKKPPRPQNKAQTKSDVLYSTVSKSSGSPAAKNYIEIKESHHHQQHRQTTNITSTSPSNQADKTYAAKQPILMLGDSMIQGILRTSIKPTNLH